MKRKVPLPSATGAIQSNRLSALESTSEVEQARLWAEFSDLARGRSLTERRIARVRKWARRKSKEAIALHLACCFVLLLLERRLNRLRELKQKTLTELVKNTEVIADVWETTAINAQPFIDAQRALLRRLSDMGRKSGDDRTNNAEIEHRKWIKTARAMIADGASDRHVSGDLAKRFGVTARAMRTVLQGAGLVPRRNKGK